MSKEKVSEDTTVSKSAKKRNERRKEVNSRKKKSKITKIAIIAVVCAILIFLVYSIGDNIYFNATKTVASSDFSANLTEEGFVDGLDVAEYVKAPDYNNIVIALSDIEYSDESVEEDIASALSENLALSTDETLVSADGDKVNIDFIGYVDGEEFEGGNTEGAGNDCTIGSGSYVDGFEDQLIGHKPGDSFTIEVTFPEDYSQNADLAGKDVTFDVVMNGIYAEQEFNDEFVQNYLSDYATSADEYRTYLKDTNYDSNLESYLSTYMTDNSAVKSYPKSYLKTLKALQRANDEYYYSYYNSYYYQLLGSYAYDSFWDYVGTSERAYEKTLTSQAKATLALNFTYQYIFEAEGLTVTDELYSEVIATYNSDADATAAQESYGKGFLMQQAMKTAVINYLKTVATVQ